VSPPILPGLPFASEVSNLEYPVRLPLCVPSVPPSPASPYQTPPDAPRESWLGLGKFSPLWGASPFVLRVGQYSRHFGMGIPLFPFLLQISVSSLSFLFALPQPLINGSNVLDPLPQDQPASLSVTLFHLPPLRLSDSLSHCDAYLTLHPGFFDRWGGPPSFTFDEDPVC